MSKKGSFNGTTFNGISIAFNIYIYVYMSSRMVEESRIYSSTIVFGLEKSYKHNVYIYVYTYV